MDGDFIGFTNEGTVGAISFSYDAEGRTLFVGQNAEAMPRIGDVFTFNNQLQANFSVAVQLSTGESDHDTFTRLATMRRQLYTHWISNSTG